MELVTPAAAGFVVVAAFSLVVTGRDDSYTAMRR
jgi:hypothetical protein